MSDYLRQRWVEEEACRLALHFGEVEYDECDGSWVMLPHFPLAPGLGRAATALLVELPAAYPAIPPDGVYVDRDLPLDDHYFPQASEFNPYAREGWAWLCLHARRGDKAAWRPGARVGAGDNLLVLLVLARALLDESARRWAGAVPV